VAESVRSLVGRIGAHALHATHDSTELTAAARSRFLASFIDKVDPDRALSEPERLKRAEHALRQHMTRLALKSAKARAARKAAP
jgi:hypothetical protein